MQKKTHLHTSEMLSCRKTQAVERAGTTDQFVHLNAVNCFFNNLHSKSTVNDNSLQLT